MDFSDTDIFKGLIGQFHVSGLAAMGKMIHPASGKVDKNKSQAQYCIDVLHMLQNRTNGRRTDEEDSHLSGVLAQLKINFTESFTD